MESARPVRVLFLCTHNSARSQMAEAILRHLGEDRVEVHSAGTEVTRVHPLAIQAMAAQGIDMTGHRSKHMDELLDRPFDYVITVCDNARQSCPLFPGPAERLHWSLADPSAVAGEEEARWKAFQATADELRVRIGELLPAIWRLASRGASSS